MNSTESTRWKKYNVTRLIIFLTEPGRGWAICWLGNKRQDSRIWFSRSPVSGRILLQSFYSFYSSCYPTYYFSHVPLELDSRKEAEAQHVLAISRCVLCYNSTNAWCFLIRYQYGRENVCSVNMDIDFSLSTVTPELANLLQLQSRHSDITGSVNMRNRNILFLTMPTNSQLAYYKHEPNRNTANTIAETVYSNSY